MNVENYWGVHVLGQRAYFGQIPGVWLWYERGDNRPCKGLVYCCRGALWAVWLIWAFSSLCKFVKTLKDWFYYLSLIMTESKRYGYHAQKLCEYFWIIEFGHTFIWIIAVYFCLRLHKLTNNISHELSS